MAAPKARSPRTSEAMDREINALDIRGYTQAEIAAKLGIGQSAVSHRLKKLNARAVNDRADHIARELRTLDNVLHEALDAWERSKADSEITLVERRASGDVVSKRTEASTGTPAHLANVLRASENRRKLLGLDAPLRTEHSGPDGAAIQIEDARDHLADRLARFAASPDTSADSESDSRPASAGSRDAAL